MTCGNPNCIPCNRKLKAAATSPPVSTEPDLYRALLRLVCDGQPVGAVEYSLLFNDGTRMEGITDSGGLLIPVVRERPTRIIRVTLTPGSSGTCCSAPNQVVEAPRIYIGDGATPVATTVLTRTQPPVTIVPLSKGEDRGLTRGEEMMARTVFGDGINYGTVRVNNHGYRLFFGLQDPNTAVTPNGQMYMPPALYRDDYSESTDADRRLFMHEMVHVWQNQMGYPVRRKGLTVTSRGATAYAYTLTPTSRLSDFNMEQQGNLMSDYYMICIYQAPGSAYNPAMNPIYLRQVMLPFVNPKDPQHLPSDTL